MVLNLKAITSYASTCIPIIKEMKKKMILFVFMKMTNS